MNYYQAKRLLCFLRQVLLELNIAYPFFYNNFIQKLHVNYPIHKSKTIIGIHILYAKLILIFQSKNFFENIFNTLKIYSIYNKRIRKILRKFNFKSEKNNFLKEKFYTFVI